MTSAEDQRINYPNLDSAVALFRCTADDPMDIAIGPRAEELKQLWIHDGFQELGESDTGRYVHWRCVFCKFETWTDLGD